MTKRYRLIKDLPDAKAGTILEQKDNADYYYKNIEGESTWWKKSHVETMPDWFEEANEDRRVKYARNLFKERDDRVWENIKSMNGAYAKGLCEAIKEKEPFFIDSIRKEVIKREQALLARTWSDNDIKAAFRAGREINETVWKGFSLHKSFVFKTPEQYLNHIKDSDEYTVICITVDKLEISDNNAIAKAKNPHLDIPSDTTLRINAIIDIEGHITEELKEQIAEKLASAILNYQFTILGGS